MANIKELTVKIKKYGGENWGTWDCTVKGADGALAENFTHKKDLQYFLNGLAAGCAILGINAKIPKIS